MPENLVLLLTPPGVAGIAVVRVRGPLTASFLRSYFSTEPRAGRCLHGRLAEADRAIDDPVVVLHEDGMTADINLHGGSWVVRSVLDLAERFGFTVAANEFPLRAEAVDGATPVQQEVLRFLPRARTELAVRVLLAQPSAWQDLEARAADGRLAPGELEEIAQDRTLDHLLQPPRVAIAGIANVGKSTLANQLFAQERSITADVAGTTRDWVGEIANIDGLAVMLLDTPGVRESPDAVEREAIARSRGEIASGDLIVLVMDATQPLEPEQAALVEAYPSALKVVNKIDRMPAWNATASAGIQTVGTTGVGIDRLRAAIAAHFGFPVAIDRPRCWTPQQRELLRTLAPRPLVPSPTGRR